MLVLIEGMKVVNMSLQRNRVKKEIVNGVQRTCTSQVTSFVSMVPLPDV